MTTNRTDAFLAGLEEIAARPQPESVIREARMCLVDYLACAYLGQASLTEQTASCLLPLSSDSGGAVLIGGRKRVSTHLAALLNGIHAHAQELDDGHRYGMVHPGVPVLSALLAVAGSVPMTGEQFIRGTVMGYEAAVRLASAVQPGHKFKGGHATGTCGAIGAAMALAYAMDYTPEQKKATLSAAATDAAGLLEMIDNTSTLKPYNAGRAAVAAVDAFLIGGAGFSGPIDPLGGKRGFFAMMAGEVNDLYLTEGFSTAYAIERIYRKPYAACRHCHAAIEAAMVTAQQHGLTPESIQDVRIQTYGLAVGGHDHREVSGVSSAKMSTPYSVAAALVYGKADFQQFTPACIADSRVQELMGKVRVEESAELSALVPAKRSAVATLTTADGTYATRVDYPKGEPENPITEAELNGKFLALLEAADRSADQAREVLDAAWHAHTDLTSLLGTLERI